MTDLVSYACFFLTTASIYAIICLGLNVQWGYAGLFNVGVAGFVAIGGYVAALLTAAPAAGRWGGWSWPIPAGWIAAMLVAGATGAVVAALTMRLRADYLAITSFGVAASIELVALNAERLTGGAFGIAFIPKPFASLASRPLAFDAANLALVASLLAVVYAATQRLARGPWGRVLRAIREDEVAAASLGKSAVRCRLEAFVIGAALMGLAGAVQGQLLGFIAPENYLPALTFQTWVMLVLGGSGNNRGAVIGAFLVWALWAGTGAVASVALPQVWQSGAASLRLVLIGAVLALVLVIRPRGLLGEEATISRHIGDA